MEVTITIIPITAKLMILMTLAILTWMLQKRAHMLATTLKNKRNNNNKGNNKIRESFYHVS